MNDTLLKIGEKTVVNGITMICTESPCKGCKGCDVLNMNVTCDDWLCSSKHRPDGKDTIMLAERFELEGKMYVKVPFVGCCACAFGGRDVGERPCSECEDGMDMYKEWHEDL